MTLTSATEITVTEALVFAVPEHYTSGPEFPSFQEAVDYARSTIQTFDYGTLGKRHSRAFVDLRASSLTLHDDGRTSRVQEPIMRWEVFLTCVAAVPAGQGGLTIEQQDLLIEQGKITDPPAGR